MNEQLKNAIATKLSQKESYRWNWLNYGEKITSHPLTKDFMINDAIKIADDLGWHEGISIKDITNDELDAIIEKTWDIFRSLDVNGLKDELCSMGA